MSRESGRWVAATVLIVGGLTLAVLDGRLDHHWSVTGAARLADVARYLTFLLGAGVIAVTLVTTAAYGHVYRLYRARTDQGETWRGLLPRHVVLIGISYLMMIVGSLADLTTRVHEPLSWRTPIYAFTYILGIWSLWDVLGNAKHRYVDLIQTHRTP